MKMPNNQNDVVIDGRNISKELSPLGGQQSRGVDSASTRPPQAHISSNIQPPTLKGSVDIRQPTRVDLMKKRLGEVGKSTWTSVVEPALKGMLWGALLSIGSAFIFKGKQPPSYPGGSLGAPLVNNYTPPWRTEPYLTYWAQPQTYDWQRQPQPGRPIGQTQPYINPRDVVFTNEDDAHEVLFTLMDIIAKDGVATVGQFRELVRQTPEYTDYTYGWRSLEGTCVKNFGGRFVIDFPPTGVV